MFGQILGHALRERCNEYALLLGDALVNFFDEVINLVVGRAHFDFWIEEAGWANDLFGWHWAVAEFIFAWCCRNINNLINMLVEFVEGEWAVIERGR